MRSIKIKTIELTNYRQFVGQKIEFKLNKNKNMIIIEGKNGFGKSNIFNAINWCFFGVEEHLRPDSTSLPICSTKRLNEVKPGKSIETVVKIILDTDEGGKEIERSAVTYKYEEGKYRQEEPELKAMEQIGKNWKPAAYPQYLISRILPKDMRHFFFIDGEKLRQIFENINPAQIKKSIFDLSQITLLQNAADHLETFKGTFRKTIKGEPDLNWIEEAIERSQEKVNSQKEELKKLISEIDTAFINKKKLDAEVEKVGDKNIQVLEGKRKSLEENIELLESSIAEKKQEYAQYLFKVAPAIISKKAIENTLSIISKLENTSELPPKIQATFLEELLGKQRCICDTDLKKKENRSKKEKLEKLLEKAKYSAIANDTLELKYLLKSLTREGQGSDEKISEFELKLKGLEDDVTGKQKRLKNIITQIGNTDVAKVKAIHEEREKYKQTIYEYKGRIGRVEQSIRLDEDRLRELNKQYNLLLGKKDKYKVVKEKIALCDASIKQLEIISEKIMDEIRNETELHVREYFSKLITAKKFEEVEISRDYELIVKKDGFNAVTSLSAAETLCMGYSFMSALRQTSGFLAPIVIDTPLAKIDIEYRINVAEWFKKALINAQVILLVTDAEYTAEFRKAIGSFVNQEFSLRYDEKNGISKVVEYGK